LDGKAERKECQELAIKVAETLRGNAHWIHTITADNGKEFAEHEKIAKAIDIDFFFAKPYHSWERGANENLNGLVRQYFPKKTSFESITNQDVKYVQYKLNNRPRKKLGFLSPIEFLSLNLSNQKVAFVT